jgi:hypothetical protein
MTSTRRKATAVTLTRDQLAAIILDHMGWQEEDLDVFWKAARRETRNPGIHAAEHAAYCAKAFAVAFPD